MRELEARIPVRDGSWLAATLYLPDESEGRQPCLLEALPYRKDDLTSSYAEGYRSMCQTGTYAVARIDVRGTGSSAGDAEDEYPEVEQRDLVDAIAWLAAQDWCDGQVGMWGTSYSGFNSLQVAAQRPPELKAICSIFASDDRWTDDVHWRGGALKLLDLVDYNHYMTAMAVLPPVPAVWGQDWRAEWEHRVETGEPWVLTWLRENRHSPYWDQGSLRLGGTATGYERIGCPVLLVAGWADGYRNIAFRATAELARHGVPHRLLAGPWAHADPATAMPGPRIDFDAELLAWFDHWLRGSGEHEDRCDVFVRTSTRPAIDLDQHEGYWVTLPSVPPVQEATLDLSAPVTLVVAPDVGTAAWIDCAGHLPWGLSDDQRLDDERSLTWEVEPPPNPVVGHPVFRARLWATEPAASISVKLCDVFPDGTSALVARGTLDLAYRDGVHGPPSPLVPGREVQVEVVLDACAYRWTPGNTLRVSVAGADWPTTVAPPAPVSMTLRTASLTLPFLEGEFPEPTFRPGAEHSAETTEGIGWSLHHDVLTGTTSATTRIDSRYATPYDGTAHELYLGEVSVNTRTFAQRMHGNAVYELTWPGIEVTVRSVMTIDITATSYDVYIWTQAALDGESISERTWRESIPR
ncbi:MAG TPA: CocE/NonD family hydrolase [Nocardioides sp.]|uniref:CocE/NonD family hydrolase n=1 Tax=Nocardioides sp. TaxID=35761 RepID=UPI002E351467|nr:CocE/NonD family hydrolase [Nocardioides sp.]HEX3931566.1 CocE/NonD family hydrolase [Nocardioides sp.]